MAPVDTPSSTVVPVTGGGLDVVTVVGTVDAVVDVGLVVVGGVVVVVVVVGVVVAVTTALSTLIVALAPLLLRPAPDAARSLSHVAGNLTRRARIDGARARREESGC